jgi:hypothetical protein
MALKLAAVPMLLCLTLVATKLAATEKREKEKELSEREWQHVNK